MTDVAPAAVDVGAPGTITVVDTETNPSVQSRKRSRENVVQAPDDPGAPEARRNYAEDTGVAAPTYHVSEQEAYGEEPVSESDEEGEENEPQSQIHRLLAAKRRRRRLNRHMGNDQIQEDLDDVKKFLSLSEADKEAWLAIYEYDGSGDQLVEGLAKASSLALRLGLATTVPPKDYDLVNTALEMPEVKDGIAAMWDCVDIAGYADTKFLKAAAAVGHVGDTMAGALMKCYQGINRAAQLRDRRDQMALRQQSTGVQSIFDVSGQNGKQNLEGAQPQPTTEGGTLQI